MVCVKWSPVLNRGLDLTLSWSIERWSTSTFCSSTRYQCSWCLDHRAAASMLFDTVSGRSGLRVRVRIGAGAVDGGGADDFKAARHANLSAMSLPCIPSCDGVQCHFKVDPSVEIDLMASWIDEQRRVLCCDVYTELTSRRAAMLSTQKPLLGYVRMRSSQTEHSCAYLICAEISVAHTVATPRN